MAMDPAEVGTEVPVHLHMRYPAQPTVPAPVPLEATVLEAVAVLETVTEITEEKRPILRQLSNRSIPYIPQRYLQLDIKIVFLRRRKKKIRIQIQFFVFVFHKIKKIKNDLKNTWIFKILWF